MKDPAVLFYTSDFLTGTLTMTNEQKGKYITLLCLQHQKGLLSDKDMISICKSYDEDVYNKFIKEGDFYYNERMKFEREKRSSYSESRSKNRLKGLETKKTSLKKIYSSYDNHMENENINENIDLNINEIKKEKEQKFNFRKSMVEYGFDEKLVDEWMQVRRTKKATNSETAFKSFIGELNSKKVLDHNEVLKMIVERSWSGFKWSWIDNNNLNFNKNGNSTSNDRLQRTNAVANTLDKVNILLGLGGEANSGTNSA